MISSRTLFFAVAAAAALAALTPRAAHGVAGRLGLHGVRMEPNGATKELGEASWGGGIEGLFVIPGSINLIAGSVGFEIVNFDTKEFRSKPDPFSFERTLSTSEDLSRFYLGVQFGPHGAGLLQPFVAVHGSLAWHMIRTTLAEEYDNPDLNVSQTESESDFGLGYDVTVGLHLNLYNRFGVYGGARYLRLSGIDQPIGDDRRTIDPEYVEGFAGITLDFGFLESLGRE